MSEKKSDHKLQEIVEKTLAEQGSSKPVEKLRYVMDFGDMTIQYDFCKN